MAGAGRQRAGFWWAAAALAAANICACVLPFVLRRELVLEWRKGPLIYDCSPYSSANAAKLFWPLCALAVDLYVVLFALWQRASSAAPDRMRRAAAPVTAAALLLSLAAAEGTARTVIRRFLYLQYRPDPDLLWYNRPNLRDHTDPTDPVPKSTNRRGFRGRRDPAPAKPSGELRIFLAGDSSTFGLGVPDEATYGAVLGERLRAATGRPVYVANTACPGHTSVQGLRLLARHGGAVQPDLVVWAYNNDPCLDMLAEKQRLGERPAGPLRRALYRSDLFLLFERVALDTLYGWNADEFRRRFRREEEGWVPRIPFDDFRVCLARFAEEAEARGSRVLYVRMPLNRPVCEKMPIYYTSFDDRYRDYVETFCRERGEAYMDAEALFGARADPGLFLPGHLFHPSIAGHRLLGETLADGILGAGLLPPAGAGSAARQP